MIKHLLKRSAFQEEVSVTINRGDKTIRINIYLIEFKKNFRSKLIEYDFEFELELLCLDR